MTYPQPFKLNLSHHELGVLYDILELFDKRARDELEHLAEDSVAYHFLDYQLHKADEIAKQIERIASEGHE